MEVWGDQRWHARGPHRVQRRSLPVVEQTVWPSVPQPGRAFDAV